MKFDIIHEIRRMEKKYHEKYGCRGEVICLDAEAEARFAAYLIDSYYRFPEIYVNTEHLIKNILEDGIRGMSLTICRMMLKFDCSSFCIDGAKPEWITLGSIYSLLKTYPGEKTLNARNRNRNPMF